MSDFAPHRRIIGAIVASMILLPPSIIGASGSDDALPIGVNVISIDTGSSASLFPHRTGMPDRPFSDSSAPKALIVHVDPRDETLTAAARDILAESLVDEGWEVEVRNLYDEEFDPVASAEETTFGKPPTLQPDPAVLEYQSLISRADALVLVYPLWWNQPPAMLKGWQDRIFTYGFAYEFVAGAPESVISLLPGKKVLIINVVAGNEDIFEGRGYLKYLDMADESLFSVTGMEIVDRHIIYSSTAMDMEEKARCIQDLSPLISLLDSDY